MGSIQEGITNEYYNQLVENYIDDIEKYKYKINKNFNDMDLSNASIQRDIYMVVYEMMKKCDALIAQINSYYFE